MQLHLKDFIMVVNETGQSLHAGVMFQSTVFSQYFPYRDATYLPNGKT